MGIVTRWMDRTFYPSFQNNWDNDIFRNLVERVIERDSVLLDAGAGRGALPQMNFKGKVAKTVGVDPSKEVLNNPFLDEAHVGFCDSMPFLASDSIDIAVSNNVLEHVENPEPFLKEIRRVLRPGGKYIVKTPNVYHYMPTISRFTPHWFHTFYNGLRGTAKEDLFPTRYKINSSSALHKYAEKVGFKVVDLTMVEGRPEYLRIFSPFYLIGLLYERLVNGLGLTQFRIVMFAVLEKDPSIGT